MWMSVRGHHVSISVSTLEARTDAPASADTYRLDIDHALVSNVIQRVVVYPH